MSNISLDMAVTALQNISELDAELKALREENAFLKEQNKQLVDALTRNKIKDNSHD